MGIAHDLAYELDPVQFSRAAGIEPDPWQADVLTSDASRILLNCSRQSGKSSTVATLAAHTATYRENSLILIVSPTERQSAETLLKTRTVLDAVGWPEPAIAEGVTHLELKNGSRVIALPGKEATIRGFSAVTLLVFDEAARVDDALYASTRPMLAVSGGRLIALSTPYGTRGWYYQAYCDRERNGWKYHEITATQCPRISAEYLEEERRTNGFWWFDQEYMGKFLDSKTAAFRSEDIEAAFTDTPRLLNIEYYLQQEAELHADDAADAVRRIWHGPTTLLDWAQSESRRTAAANGR